jgi:hypothetical protein
MRAAVAAAEGEVRRSTPSRGVISIIIDLHGMSKRREGRDRNTRIVASRSTRQSQCVLMCSE